MPLRLVHGTSPPTMTSYKAPSKQSYSLLVHRDGSVEVVYPQSQNASHSNSSSTRQHASASIPSASPRSTAATFGSSNTRVASSTAHRDSPASGNKHLVPEPSTHHRHSSESRRNSSSHTSHHLVPPTSGERHRHHSMTSTERPSLPISIPAQRESRSSTHGHSHERSRSRSRSHTPSPQSSPKHARFALPSTSPVVTSSGHLAAPTARYSQTPVAVSPHRSPQRQSSTLAVPTSRHRPSTSAESFFFLESQPQRPKGWYNRRGDRFVQKGLVERPVNHLQWHPTFKDYPEPGEGWMDHNGHLMPMGGGILKN